MRFAEILAECQRQRPGPIRMSTARAIAEHFKSDSPAARTFTATGAITVPWNELWEQFFPKCPRSWDAWTIALAMHAYLYSRRHRTDPPKTWKDKRTREIHERV